nr:MAG TPA: hypothetical protein [Caudoviricetes sp.]
MLCNCGNDALCICIREVHAVQVVILPIPALALRHCDKLAVFAVHNFQIEERRAGDVQSEHTNPVGNEVTGLHGCALNGQIRLDDFGSGVLFVLVKHDILSFHYKVVSSSENPTEHELFRHAVAVGRKKGRGALVGVNRSNVMLLGLKLCRLLFHGLATVTAGRPLGGIWKTTTRGLFKGGKGQWVKFAHAVNDVQKIAVLVINKAVYVLCRVLIQQGMRNVCRRGARAGAGARVSHWKRSFLYMRR